MPELELGSHHTIHYIDSNPDSPSTVLLLHGLGATGDSWSPQIATLSAAGFRVVAPDARSFGRSSYPGKTSIAAMAADFDRLLTALGIDCAHVVGISMGGTIALQMALDHADRVDRLALVNTFATLRPDSLGVWLYICLRLLVVHTVGLPAQARMVARRIFPHDHQEAERRDLIRQVCQADPRGYRATGRALLRFDATPRLGEITAPTLVVTAEHDTTVPPSSQRALADGIAGARREIIAGAGHAVITDHPDEFNRSLLEFLPASTVRTAAMRSAG
jgi:3-oxoadipate enol-lactonase